MKSNWVTVILVILSMVVGASIVWGVNSQVVSRNKQDITESKTELLLQHDKVKDLEKCIEVNKSDQNGINNLIKNDLETLNRKLDAIIDAINSKNGFLICDPIKTEKKSNQ